MIHIRHATHASLHASQPASHHHEKENPRSFDPITPFFCIHGSCYAKASPLKLLIQSGSTRHDGSRRSKRKGSKEEKAKKKNEA